jgi:hypothetical protein
MHTSLGLSSGHSGGNDNKKKKKKRRNIKVSVDHYKLPSMA